MQLVGKSFDKLADLVKDKTLVARFFHEGVDPDPVSERRYNEALARSAVTSLTLILPHTI